MSEALHYIQQCPTCGRRVQVRLEYSGRRLACEHCHGVFIANASEHDEPVHEDVLGRVDELLATVSAKRVAQQPSSEIPDIG